MEQKTSPSFQKIALSLLIGLAAIPCAFLPLLAFLLPAALAFVWVAWGTGCFAAALAVSAGSLVVLGAGDVVGALYVLAGFVPAAAWIGYALRTKKPYRTVAVGGAVAIAAGFYIQLCLPSILVGEGPFAGIEQSFLAMLDGMEAVAGEMAGEGMFNTESLTEALDTLRVASVYTPQFATAVIAGLGMAFGLIDTVLARRMALAAKVQLKPMAPFPLWQLSRNYTVLTLLLLVTALVTVMLELANAGAVLVLAECVILLPLMLMGVCFMDFITRVMPGRGAMQRVIFYISTVLLFPYSMLLLLILGVIDRFSRLRRRFRPRD